MTIILWALLTFPHSSDIETRYDEARAGILATTTDAAAQEEQLAELEGRHAGEQLRYSIGGPGGPGHRAGHRAPSASTGASGSASSAPSRRARSSSRPWASCSASREADEESVSLRESLQRAEHADGSPLMTPLAGVSLMVFFVLACQCMSTIVVVRRESGSWGWPVFMFGYMSVLAYVASLAVYQVGSALGWGV